jgi:hypothetical protein
MPSPDIDMGKKIVGVEMLESGRLLNMHSIDEIQALNQVVDHLVAKFPTVSREQIAQAVSAQLNAHEGARVRNYLPILIERTVATALRYEAQHLLTFAL